MHIVTVLLFLKKQTISDKTIKDGDYKPVLKLRKL